MGFNKKFIDKDFILTRYNNKTPVKEIFKADALIFLDEYSKKFYELVLDGIKEDEIFKLLENNQKNN